MRDGYYDYFDASVQNSSRRPTNDEYSGDYDYSDNVYIGDEWKKEKQNVGPKCECGALKTYGPTCPVEYHSKYCPLSK